MTLQLHLMLMGFAIINMVALKGKSRLACPLAVSILSLMKSHPVKQLGITGGGYTQIAVSSNWLTCLTFVFPQPDSLNVEMDGLACLYLPSSFPFFLPSLPACLPCTGSSWWSVVEALIRHLQSSGRLWSFSSLGRLGEHSVFILWKETTCCAGIFQREEAASSGSNWNSRFSRYKNTVLLADPDLDLSLILPVSVNRDVARRNN